MTVKYWLEVLEKMYLIFIVRPFTKNLARAIQKPLKIYFFDNADLPEDDGIRFENLVATHLLKRIHFEEDALGHRMELCCIRDKEGREVDFAIVKDGQLQELVEAKWSDSSFSPSLSYYSEKLQPKCATQVVGKSISSFTKGRSKLVSAVEYFMPESLPDLRKI